MLLCLQSQLIYNVKETIVYMGIIKVGKDSKFAICSLCHAFVFRGGKTTKMFNAIDLVQRLNVAHVDLHSEYQKEVQLYTEK